MVNTKKKHEKKMIMLSVLSNRTDEEEHQLNDLFREKLDWAWITGQLIRHRLDGYFYSFISEEQKGYLFYKIVQAFKLLSDCYKEINIQNLKITETLFKSFEDKGIKVAGLKGVIFNTSIYTLNIRRSNDIDLLVDESDLSKIDTIMRAHGFIQSLDGGKTEASRSQKLIQIMNYHDLVPYYKKIDNKIIDQIKIDINFQFDSKENEITRAILDYGIDKYEMNGYKVRGLNRITHLSHLAVHFFREASNSLWSDEIRDVELYKLVDIENTIRGFSKSDLNDWVNVSKQFNLQKQCYFTLYYLNQFYPKEIYKDLMDKIMLEDNSFVQEIYIKNTNNKVIRTESFIDKAFNMSYGINIVNNQIETIF